MDEKNYLDRAGLSHFYRRLKEVFSPLSHKHKNTDIEGLQEFVVTDDGEGNVVIEFDDTDESSG